MHSISTAVPTTINIKQRRLTDRSLVYSVIVRQADGVVEFDALSYSNAWQLANAFAGAVASHTNDRAPINDWTA